jgi:hypothetical protein
MNQNQRCEVLKRSLQLRKEGYPVAEAEFIATQDVLQGEKSVRAARNETDIALETADNTGGSFFMWVFYSFIVAAAIIALGFEFA